MAYSDLIYFQSDADHRLIVEFLIDSGNPASDSDWIDFNARYPAGQPDYYAGLINRPTITERVEDRVGVYVSEIDSLRFRNDPWNGNLYGFWDATLPVTIRGKTFSSWRRRKVRIRVQTFLPDGTSVTDTLGTFRVKDLDTTLGEAEITLVGVHQVLMTKKAGTVKDGTRWFQSHPIGALIKKLANAADPAMAVTGCDSIVDMGTHTERVASSWGPCPGVLSSGVASTYHWIPRCFAVDDADDSLIWVGFEVPGSYANSGGGIAKFDCMTGRWTVIVHPESYSLSGYTFRTAFPVSIWGAGGLVFYLLVEENPTPWPIHVWHYLRGGYLNPVNGVFDQYVSQIPYWPARCAYRKGTAGAHDTEGTISLCGYIDGRMASGYDFRYYGESVPVPFPQHLNEFQGAAGWQWPYSNDPYRYFDGFRVDGTDLADQTMIGPVGSPAHYTARSRTGQTWLYPRFFMNTTWHAPLRYSMNQGGNPYDRWVWVGTNAASPKDYTIRRWKIVGGTAVDEWVFSLGTGDDVWFHHVTAWALAPSQTGTSLKMLLAVVDWDEGMDVSMRRSPIRLVEVTATVNASDVPTAATMVDKYTYTPTVNSMLPTIVSLYTPYADGYEGKRTADHTVACIYNRAQTAGPCYGIGVWNGTAWAEIYGVGTYNGPVSSKPFKGFILDQDSKKIYFIDTATGQVHSVKYTAGFGTVSWGVENQGRAAHQTECDLSSVGGVYCKPSDDNTPRVFWSLAPGPHGDVMAPPLQRDQSRVSAKLRQPGLYPMIQFSTKIADAVEIAEFDGINCWRAICDLKQRAPTTTLRVSRTGGLALADRDSGTELGYLSLKANTPFPAIAQDNFPFWTYAKRILWDDVINSVVVTPWMVQPVGDPQKQEIRSAGSTFQGKMEFLVTSERPLRMRIVCHKGCDLGYMLDGASRRTVALFSYSRILETLAAYLTLAAGDTSTTITVSGFHIRGSSFYCGDQIVRVGDSAQVLDGTLRTITGIEAVTDSGDLGASVRLTLDAAIGVNARAGSRVEIQPQDGASRSDAELTTLAAAINDSVTAITVTDASVLRKSMVLKIEAELVRITAINGNTLTITRGLYGSFNVSHAAGVSISGYLAIHEPNAMYAVGDTGVWFGLYVGSDLDDPADRSVAAGDGLIITSRGYSLQKNEAATVTVVDGDSIKDFEYQEDQVGDDRRKINENRFVDLTLAPLMGQTLIDTFGDPRIGLFDVPMPFFPRIQAGSILNIGDRQIIPSGISQGFEVTGMAFRTSNWTQELSLRSINAATGVGKAPVLGADDESRGGTAIPREEDR